MFRTLFSILFITITAGFTALYGQRAMYVDDFDEILGDKAKEEQLLSYAKCNNITKLLLYDLYHIHQQQDLTQVATNGTLARFIERAKLTYGITEMGATGENASFYQNVIDLYNNSRSFAFERFDVYNLEFEFWNSSLYSSGGVYCQDYLSGTYGCNAAGALQFYDDQLAILDVITQSSSNPVILETYVSSYISAAAVNTIASYNSVKRVLIASYVPDPINSFICSPASPTHLVLKDFGSNSSNRAIDISIIYSSEPSFMQTWLEKNSMVDAENTFTGAYNGCTGAWKANITLLDFTYFAYHDLWEVKVDNNGWVMCYLPEVTLACVGDNFTLNCGVTGATYQWQTDGSGSFSDMVGETGSSLTVTNIGSPQEGQGYRVATTLNGCTRYSNVSTLHLNFQDYLKTVATMALPGEPLDDGDFFGNAVDMTSNRAIITSCEDLHDETGNAPIGSPGAGPGSAFIYKTDPNGNWIPDQKIVASDRAFGAMYGISAGLSPTTDVAIVGDHRKDVGGNIDAGGAYIYELLGGVWAEVAILNATGVDLQVNGLFGHSVSVYDNTAVVGAPGENGDVGAVYVFTKSGGLWSPIYTRIAPPLPNPGDQFGYSVDIYGNYLIVGAPGADANGTSSSGEAYIFEDVSGTWTLRNTINDNAGQVDERLGNSVSIGNRTAAIGSSKEDAGATTDAGSVEIYNFMGTGWAWSTNLTPSLRETNARFGQSVSVSDDYIAVGTYTSLDENNANSLLFAGGAYVYTNNGNYVELQKLVAFDRAFADGMGRSIATNGDFVLVGAAEDDHSSFTNPGSAYFFQACASIPLGPGAGLEPFVSSTNHIEDMNAPIIYPNPSSGAFTIELNDSWNEEAVNIRVYDLAGNLVQSQTISSKAEETVVNNLESGCYLINISGENHHSQHKVIVH